jgi:hypothetical protein
MATRDAEEAMDFTHELTAMAKAQGASLVGVAPVERFRGAPSGHHPTDLLPGARVVVSFGIRLLERERRPLTGNSVCGLRSPWGGEAMPTLAALVGCCSLFDIALHDAYVQLLG